MRFVLGCGLAVALVVLATEAGAAAKETPDAKKLVGKWSPKDLPAGASVVIGFTKDGKVTVDVEFGGKTETKSGTYKLEGDKLTVTIGEEKGKTSTIVKLTDEVLEIKNDKDKATTLVRVKAK